MKAGWECTVLIPTPSALSYPSSQRTKGPQGPWGMPFVKTGLGPIYTTVYF